MAGARPKDQRRADYFLYTWQIRAIRHLADERSEPPSQVVRELLSQALSGPAEPPATAERAAVR
jgi:hypothetical protein